MSGSRIGRYVAASLGGMMLAATLTGCGGNRSTESFCSTVREGGEQLRATVEQTEALSRENALMGLISAFGTYGDLAQFLDRLAETAPSEIEDDMNVIAEDFQESLNTSGRAAGELLTGNPAGLAQLLFRQLTHVNSYVRVGQFAEANCDLPIFAPAPASE